MRKEQHLHLVGVLRSFNQRAVVKYKKGAQEHKGNLQSLTELELLDEAIDENVDSLVYLLTLRDKINDRNNRGSAFQGRSTVC